MSVERGPSARERDAAGGARLLQTARDERDVASGARDGADEAVTELAARMQADSQVPHAELELVLADIRVFEAKVERPHDTRALLAAFTALAQQGGVAIERHGLAPKELRRQA